MGRVCHVGLLVFALLILILAVVSHAELHRAKTSSKYGNNPKPSGRRLNGRTEVHHQYLDHYPPKPSEPSQTLKPNRGHSSETWVYSIISALLVGLSGIFPLLVIPLESGKALRDGASFAELQKLLSFAVGGLLGDVFLHLLPEAWAHIRADDHSGQRAVGLWVLVGIFTFLLIEKIFPDDKDEATEADNETMQEGDALLLHTRDSDHNMCNGCLHKRCVSHRPDLYSAVTDNGMNSDGSHCDEHKNGFSRSDSEATRHCSGVHEEKKQHIKTTGWLNLFANAIDNFTHGLAVAGSFCVSNKTGVLTTLAILLHELPHEVGDFAILLRSGFDRWEAAKAQLTTASGALIGVLVALFAESAQEAGDRTAWILPFTAGGFIYIALVSVISDLLKETNLWESLKQLLLLCSGIAVMATVTVLSD